MLLSSKLSKGTIFLDFDQAKFCVRGRELLYRYCSEHGIAHRKIGKLVVATASWNSEWGFGFKDVGRF